MSQGQRVVLGAWLAMIVLATVRHVSDPSTTNTLPPANNYIASGVLFTMFYGGSSFAPSLFGALSIGVVLAAVVKPYATSRGAIPQSGPIFQLANLLDSLSGTKTTAAGAAPGG